MAGKKTLLNNEEISQIIQNFGKTNKVSIIDWTLAEKNGRLTGFLGGYFKLKVEALINDKPVIKHFFVKTLPASTKQSEYIQGMSLFQKEAKIYSDILDVMSNNGLTKWSPKSYYTRDDVIVLDDLSTEGYSLLPARQNFTKNHVQLVLKSLAAMHANSIHFEKEILKQKIDKVYDEILFEVSINKTNAWFNTGLGAIKCIAINRTKFSNDPTIILWIQNNFDTKISKLYEMCHDFPKNFTKTLCHRDIWQNNLMYKFDSTPNGIDFNKPLECLLIDYQIARYMPPGVDISMTLYMLQRVRERKDDFQENLKYYYNQLKQSMQDLRLNVEEYLPFEEFLETIDYFKLMGAVLKCIFLQMTHIPEGEIDKVHSNDDDYHQFIMVDRGDVLIKYIDTDEYFKNWIVESVEELIDMLMHDEN